MAVTSSSPPPRVRAPIHPPLAAAPGLFNTLASIVAIQPFLRFLHRRHGDAFRYRLAGHGEMVMVVHPETIREVLLDRSGKLSAALGNEILRPFVGDNSLFLLDGERHLRERRMMNPPFHGQRMRAYGALIRQCARRALEPLRAGVSVRAAELMAGVSLDIIIGAVFGVDHESRRAQFLTQVDRILRHMSGPMVFMPALHKDLGRFSPGGRKRIDFAAMHALIIDELGRRRALPAAERDARGDILSLLLAARDETGQPMTDDELHDQMLTLLVAGHETTGNALAWAMAWLHHTPRTLARLRAELTALGPDPDPEDIAAAPYLDAVCKEALRIKPIISGVGRGVLAPVEIDGYQLEPGQTILVSIYLAHHRPEVFPDSDRFRPERFLERKFSPYEYFPFGGGHRRCIGFSFAQYEMKLVLAAALQACDFELTGRWPVTAARSTISLAPLGGPRLRVIRRRQ